MLQTLSFQLKAVIFPQQNDYRFDDYRSPYSIGALGD